MHVIRFCTLLDMRRRRGSVGIVSRLAASGSGTIEWNLKLRFLAKRRLESMRICIAVLIVWSMHLIC